MKFWISSVQLFALSLEYKNASCSFPSLVVLVTRDGCSSGSVVVDIIVSVSEVGVAVEVGLDSSVQLSIANSWGEKSLMDSGDLDMPLDSLGILEEALIGSEVDHSCLEFLRRLEFLGMGTSFSSIKDTSDFKKLLLASKRDIFVCSAYCHRHTK